MQVSEIVKKENLELDEVVFVVREYMREVHKREIKTVLDHTRPNEYIMEVSQLVGVFNQACEHYYSV